MTLDYNAWRFDGAAIDEGGRAADAWRRIQRRPTVIELERGNDILAPQIVRVELSSTSSGTPEIMGMSGASSKLNAVIFGVTGHSDPAVLDTDIRRDDRFALGGEFFRVIHVVHEVGEVQALCEVES